MTHLVTDTERWVVTRDGGAMSPILMSPDACFQWLLTQVPYSVHHARTHEGWDFVELPTPDDKDLEILNARQRWLDGRPGPGVGDFVTFTGSRPAHTRRISHVWCDDEGWDGGIQTSELTEARFYLGDGYISMSGGLKPAIHSTLFKRDLRNRKRAGRVWFFHHDQHRAHNGIDAYANFRTWLVHAEPN